MLVIDELPYLTEHDAGFASDLQQAWDRGLEGMPVLLVCVGSDVRMMEELVKERSPLHGRPTLELALQPLSVPAVAQITGAADATEAIDRYLIVGGFPLLAARWPRGTSMEEFLAEALSDDHRSSPVHCGSWLRSSRKRSAPNERSRLLGTGRPPAARSKAAPA